MHHGLYQENPLIRTSQTGQRLPPRLASDSSSAGHVTLAVIFLLFTKPGP